MSPISDQPPLMRSEKPFLRPDNKSLMGSLKGRTVQVAELDHAEGDAGAPGRSFERWHGQHTKVMEILACCQGQGKHDQLARLATSTSGLVDDEVRRLACMFDKIRSTSLPNGNIGPLLLGCGGALGTKTQSWQDLPRHRDENQVELDVNRSFIYYPKSTRALPLSRYGVDVGPDESNETLDRRKRQLSDVIVQVLRQCPKLSYFQGFHDIVQVFLLVLGVDHAADAVAHLALLRIRDFMLPSLSPSLAHLRLMPAILYAVDPELYRHLSQTEPFFALAATLTLYAHDIQEYGDIARLFDFLLAHGAVVSVYFFAIIVLSRRKELFEIPADEPEMLHSVLSKLPIPLDLEALISKTIELFKTYPPEALSGRAWSKISPFSVLKTTRDLSRHQTLRDGEDLFVMQQLQLRRTELRERAVATMWSYRRPLGSVGLAVAVGIMALWLRRLGLGYNPGIGTGKFWDLFRIVFRH